MGKTTASTSVPTHRGKSRLTYTAGKQEATTQNTVAHLQDADVAQQQITDPSDVTHTRRTLYALPANASTQLANTTMWEAIQCYLMDTVFPN